MVETREQFIARKQREYAVLQGIEDPLTAFAMAGLFIGEAYGSATWAPVRPADFDEKAWGAWEAWEHLEIAELSDNTVGARPTGDWVAWHAPSGQMMGFPAPNARTKAEMFCVMQNENAPTRIVPFKAEPETSLMDFDEVHGRVHQEIENIERVSAGA